MHKNDSLYLRVSQAPIGPVEKPDREIIQTFCLVAPRRQVEPRRQVDLRRHVGPRRHMDPRRHVDLRRHVEPRRSMDLRRRPPRGSR